MKAGSVLNELCQNWIIKKNWRLCALKHKLDVGQLPYNRLLKATLLSSSLYDNDSIHLLLCICVEYCLTTWIATNEENQILSFDLQTISADRGLRAWHALKEIIRVGALGLPPICAEYGLETWLSPTGRFHVLALDLHPTCAENEHENLLGTSEEIRVIALDVLSIFAEYSLETCLSPCEKFIVASLNVRTACRRRKRTRNMTRAKRWKSCICIRPTFNLYWIWSRKMIRA